MTYRQKKQDTLLAFLTNNMREMETELRAQSIVLEALAQKVIDTDDLASALTWARESTSMLEFVSIKYAAVEELCTTGAALTTTKDARVAWREPHEIGKLPN